MHYALAPRTFLFSHYFYTGLRIATGIIGLTLLTRAISDLPTAMAVAMGALCTSLMDMPSPLRHKFNEMLAGVALSSIVVLLVSLCSPVPWLLRTVIVVVTFLASMMVVYGRKAMPLQFAALFSMMLASEEASTPDQALLHGALFFAGAACYMAYAMVVVWAMQARLKQQVLSEALYELATYTDIKAGCYDLANPLPAQMEKLVRQQIVLAERQQASRDLILRGKPSAADAALVQVHYAMFDLYELVLSTHTDYVLLRKHFAGRKVLPLLGELIGKAARDIESAAYAMTRNRPSHAAFDYTAEMRLLEQALDECSGTASGEAEAVLRATSHKVSDMLMMIGQLHAASQAGAVSLPVVSGADLTPFLTQQRYGVGILGANLRWSSPSFRFALRVAMAVSVGLVAGDFLPYQAHSYWIALTIAVILKPSFSMTRQRRADRVIGTVIGCILTAVILHFFHAPAALIGFLFIATAAAPAFLYIKYRYTAIAASMQILLLIGLTVPQVGSAITERLLDTLVGTVIATFFSYVLPNWEYQNLPRLVESVLQANRKYIDSASDLLQGRAGDDFRYRISRKGFMDSLATLSAALGRMLDEPAAKHRAPDELNRFTVQNYLLVSHIAALRLLLQRYKDGLPRSEVNAAIDQACHEVRARLGSAPPDTPAGVPANLPATASWAGWVPLQRRLKLLLQDADQLAAARGAIGTALGPA
jgi:uncharacterized membrane protein YccC